MLQEFLRGALLPNPDCGIRFPRSGLQPSQSFLLESRSLTVGYRFFVPQSRQVINTVVPDSVRVLTRQFTPGRRRLPHPLQMKSFCSLGNRTPAFIPIRRASSMYRVDRARSVVKVFLASRRRISIRSRATSLTLPPFLQANRSTALGSWGCSCNLFVAPPGQGFRPKYGIDIGSC